MNHPNKNDAQEEEHTSSDIDERVTLAFGGAATLWPYYQGVYYSMFKNFDLSEVRTTGISMGVTACFAVNLHLTPKEKFNIGLHWQSMIWNQRMGPFLMKSSDWIDTGVAVSQKCGFTDEHVKRQFGRGKVGAGITDIRYVLL